jgi:hypothetical protein
MQAKNVYERMRRVLAEMAEDVGLETDVEVSVGPLEVKDAIGTPKRRDYPLEKDRKYEALPR